MGHAIPLRRLGLEVLFLGMAFVPDAARAQVVIQATEEGIVFRPLVVWYRGHTTSLLGIKMDHVIGGLPLPSPRPWRGRSCLSKDFKFLQGLLRDTPAGSFAAQVPAYGKGTQLA
jgi:hypothetical protein